MLSVKVGCGKTVATPGRNARNCVVHAKKPSSGKGLDERGFIGKDNSGRQNIFPTSSKAYYKSPTASAVASSGLGGVQGAGVVAAALGIIVLATFGVVSKEQSSETLAQVNNAYTGDSLSAIAERLSKGL
ncbi:hypothetical protein PLESTB_000521700 [Pleodorina starrii]|uniref:Uncharacterized protein n=1 Tax=Pleodorina starrii TaxID=330485 RepID=A0A9W6BG96_9CHLO|nr:hypothetical protein PLESTM_000385200 [Pleodorina starrii]GLC51617.1 hypothetical protein PLESTB_000521700 [Pleodorina starrii]GLC72386.1 hypothetical protein PLESTF_001242000 [Pleodorina starrii]